MTPAFAFKGAVLLVAVLVSAEGHAQPPDTRLPEAILECIEKDFPDQVICLNALIAVDDSPLPRILRGDALSSSQSAAEVELATEDYRYALRKGFPLIHRVGFRNTEELILQTAEAGMVDGAEYYLRNERVGVNQQDSEKLTFLMMMFCHPGSLRDVNHLYIIKDLAKRDRITDRRLAPFRYHESFRDARHSQMQHFSETCWNNTRFFSPILSKAAVMAGMKRARIRTIKAIDNVKTSVTRFPELQMFTYVELLTTPAP